MGIRRYKPTSPGMRHRTGYTFDEITKSKPEESLIIPRKRTGGRNVYGRITTRHIGGGHKQMIRIVDFKRDKLDIPAKVIAIEYDPNRSARLALLQYQDGEKRYIVCPDGLTVNADIMAGPNAEVKPGNALPISSIPMGTPIYNIELRRGRGGQLVRSAGDMAVILAKEGEFAQIRLPSGEIRMISVGCYATVGQVGNIEHDTLSIGKAGRSRWMGIRPSVRGVAMNPVDHPMGGGEGKSSGGRHPTTPWGKKTKGLKTRKSKNSDKFIVKRRR